MACDASLPGHPILLPHECVGEETRLQFTIENQEMSFCPYHFAYFARVVTQSFSMVIYKLAKGLERRITNLEEQPTTKGNK